jgi:beta-aspartyl-peptidase (threonine type)
MTRSTRFPGLLLAGLALAGASAGRPPDELADIRAVLTEQVSAWNAGDLDRFMRTYWNSPDLRFYSGGTVTTGWQATLDRYRKRYQGDGKEMGTLTFSDLEVEKLGPDAAFARGKWALAFRKGDDKPRGLYTLILRKQADGWKIVHDHTSAADPPKKPD